MTESFFATLALDLNWHELLMKKIFWLIVYAQSLVWGNRSRGGKSRL
jgi:hypothetical protein